MARPLNVAGAASLGVLVAVIGCGTSDTKRAPIGSAGTGGRSTSTRSTDAGDAAARKPRPIDGGTVSAALTGDAGANAPSPVDLSQYGYVQEEFALDGQATEYVGSGDLGLDGKWNAVPKDQAAYATRLLVRRPAAAGRFNGTVFVEWLNVTGGSDIAIGFNMAWEELLRGGYGYVGVSAQKAGVDALKSSDVGRYGSLDHPGDAYSYDIFSQAGAAVGWPSGIDLMGGIPVKRMIAYGESQSAMRMITYVNAVQPLSHVFDGVIIHSRAGWGAPVGTESDSFLGDGKPVHVRDDTDARVFQFFTESEIFLSLGPAYAARQPDGDHLCSWEVAGAAHADQHMVGKGADLGCGLLNDGPQHFVLKAAVHAMNRWLTSGAPPPHGTPFQVNATETDIARDANGLALGGVRTPAVDVPIETLSGEPSAANAGNPLCELFGQTIPFTDQKLRELYPTHQSYVDKVTASAQATELAGFILPEEQATIVADAATEAIPP